MYSSQRETVSTQFYNWCARHTIEKGSKDTGKDFFMWLARVEFYLLASHLWMINEVGEENTERKKKRINAFYLSDNREEKAILIAQNDIT